MNRKRATVALIGLYLLFAGMSASPSAAQSAPPRPPIILGGAQLTPATNPGLVFPPGLHLPPEVQAALARQQASTGQARTTAPPMDSGPDFSPIFLMPPTYASGGQYAYSVAVADFNGDGVPDLVVANECVNENCTGGSVSVLLGNGDGTFGPAVSYSSGGYNASSVAAGDFNGDGKVDILVDNLDHTVSVLLGNGDGTFQPAISTNVSVYSTGAMAMGDFNGDGKTDVVIGNDCGTSNCSNGSVSVLLGNGDGTFQAPQSYLSGGSDVMSLAVGDFNGDGQLDVVVANECADTFCSTGSVSVLLGNGSGALQLVGSYATGRGPSYSIAVSDLNGDGSSDVAVALIDGSVAVLLGNGDGSLQPAVSYAAGENPRSIAVKDLNGDGYPDLVVAEQGSSTLTVLLGNGNGTFQPAVTYGSGGGNAFGVAVQDINGDGRADLIVANRCADIDCTSGSVSVLLGNGDGTFQGTKGYASGGQSALSVATGDFNHDGILDFAVANQCADSTCQSSSVSVLLGNGDGTFQPAASYPSGGLDASSVTVGDLNGDGKPDLVVANYCTSNCASGSVSVLLGNGDGTFQSAVSYPSGGEDAYSAAVADVNGDGKPDLVVVNYCTSNCASGSVSVLLGNGDGTFQSAVSYPSGGPDAVSVVIGDFNGDGKPDLAVANACFNYSCGASANVSVLLGNGDGTFQSAVTYASGGQSTLAVAVADFNGDGKPDLVTASECANSNCANGSVSVLLGNGDGTFQQAEPYPIASGGASLLVQDFNGDGKLDVAISQGSEVNLLLGNGDGTLQPASLYAPGGSALVAGDFNGDGKPDLAVADGSDIFVLLNIATPFHYATTTAVSSSANPSSFGQSVTFTAAVTPAFNAGALTGSVTFYDGSTALDTETINSGQASFTTSSLSSGANSITAAYSGDTNYLTSTSAVLTENITGLPATTTTLTPSPNPATYGQSVTLTATVTSSSSGTPTGSVTFKDGSSTLGTSALSGDTATLVVSSLAAGGHSITACHGGDSNFASSTSTAYALTVNQASSGVALMSSASAAAYMQTVTFTATITPQYGGTATGTVTFMDGASTLGTASVSGNSAALITNALPLGSNSVTATYSGDSNVTASTSSAVPVSVSKASTTTVVTSSANPSIVGQPVTFTVTVSPQYAGTPIGTVTLKKGNSTLTTLTLSNGQASYTTTLPTGTYSISASYAGDSNFTASVSATLTQQVETKASTTTTVTSSANPIAQGQSVTFTATVSSSGGTPPNGEIVTFKDGSATLGTGTLSGGMATLTTSSLAAGSNAIKATYPGDATFLASTSATFTETVSKNATTTTVSSSLSPSSYGQSVTFTATVSTTGSGTPTGTVTFKNGSGALGIETLSGGTASLTTSTLTVGTHSITVVYNGDADDVTSTSPAISQVVNKATTSTGLASSQNPSNSGQSVTFTATVTSSSGAVPAGAVIFKSGTRTLGSAALAGGTASFTTTTLATGSDTITATYNGSANFTGSSATLTQIVN
jgi:hypothetical protein